MQTLANTSRVTVFTYYNITKRYIYIAKYKIQSEFEYFYLPKQPDQNKKSSNSKKLNTNSTNTFKATILTNILNGLRLKHIAICKQKQAATSAQDNAKSKINIRRVKTQISKTNNKPIHEWKPLLHK